MTNLTFKYDIGQKVKTTWNDVVEILSLAYDGDIEYYVRYVDGYPTKEHLSEIDLVGVVDEDTKS